jgi:hypothetical protein
MPSKREARRIRAKDKTTENRAEKRKRGDEKPPGEKTDSPSDKKVDGKPKERTRVDSGTSAPASVPESRSNNLALDPDPGQ